MLLSIAAWGEVRIDRRHRVKWHRVRGSLTLYVQIDRGSTAQVPVDVSTGKDEENYVVFYLHKSLISCAEKRKPNTDEESVLRDRLSAWAKARQFEEVIFE